MKLYLLANELPEDEQYKLARKNSQEHRQRIDRRVCNCGNVLLRQRAGISQCGRVGCRTRNHAHNAVIVHLVDLAGNTSDDNQRNNRDEQT